MFVALSIEEIKKCIPHRDPFLLIDEVTNVNSCPKIIGSEISALKNISIDDPIFKGHFPKKPIFPGVLIIEAMAQTMAILMSYSQNDFTVPLLARIKNAKFKLPVYPGTQLVLHSLITHHKGPHVRSLTKAFVNTKLVAEAELSCHLNNS